MSRAAPLLDLIRRDAAFKQAAAAAVATFAVGERNVAGFVRRQRQRDAAEPRLHRVDAVGFDSDRHGAEVGRARDPGLQPVGRAHDLVARTVERNLAQALDTFFGKRHRREN